MGKLGMWAITGQWEGYERDRRRNRPAARKVGQDDDLNYGIREELLAEARALCQVFGIPNRILRQFANYVVGSCEIQWTTDNSDWNDTAESQFHDASQLIDAGGRHNLRSLARLAVIHAKRDGDIFFREIDEDDFYQLEAIEGDRVGNYRGSAVNVDILYPAPGIVVGGVLLDARNRPTAYRINNRDRYGNFVFAMDSPVSETIHIFDPMRFDAMRGVTAFHAALNRLRDMKETIAAQQGAQKLASKLALIFKSSLGGKRDLPGVNAFGDDTTNNGTEIKTEEVGDLAMQYMFPGDSAEVFKNDMPAQTWINFMDFLIRDISVGVDLPFEMVWNMGGMTGPAVRSGWKQADRTMLNEQSNLETRFLNRVAVRWVTKEMASGRLPFNPQWRQFKFPRPVLPSIDAGRESQADMNEYDSGINTARDLIEDRGFDADEVRVRRKAEAHQKLEDAQELADEFSIPIDAALSLIGRPNHAPVATVASPDPVTTKQSIA
jgi:capsid protein